MKLKRNKKISSWILCLMLIVAMAFTSVGCTGKKENNQTSTEAQMIGHDEVEVLGEGKKQFEFTVVDQDGNVTKFVIHTDEAIVGDALIDLGLIEGDEGAYGLYVKTVNGITADYDKDQTYWAFYVNGEYATSGVDLTEIEEGSAYSFKVEK